MSQLPARWSRVVLEHVSPSVDDGRFAVKRIAGQTVDVTADVFADGHDVVRANLLWRLAGKDTWQEAPMTPEGNDRFQASFPLAEVGRYEYSIIGWVDRFETWQRDLERRIEANQAIRVDLQIGAALVGAAAHRANGDDATRLRDWQAILNTSQVAAEYRAIAEELLATMRRYPDTSLSATLDHPRAIVADPPLAGFSAWYELFPRSCAAKEHEHGTLADCIRWMPRLAELGFNVLYLPPIHPIGVTFRKGKNNAMTTEPGDVGCPWAIGSVEGGHRSIHPQLGTLEDFDRLVTAARGHGIEVALDIAFQCSPDHPYVKEHPDWFRHRPDGTIQYAENPPKKYQDIYPFDFETSDWQALWRELTGVVMFWCSHGVRVYRVDNPHTKPFEFWESLITDVKAKYPDAIFLSEAFTRPKLMYRLAKLGFSQSYTYFTWRNSKEELEEYFTELADEKLRDYFRPNLWPNTPDILSEALKTGGRPAAVVRLVLAATLSANYGIYGPPYETLDARARDNDSEEYLDSEKYQLRHWNFDSPEGLSAVLAHVNRARRENVALQSDNRLAFHSCDNPHILCYSKHDESGKNWIVVVVNLNLHEEQHGFVVLPLEAMGIATGETYVIEDLLSDKRYEWKGKRNFVELDPAKTVAHVFRLLPRA